MGKAMFFFGAVGGGTRIKLAVNMVMGTMLASLGEGLSLTKEAGIEAKLLLEVLDLGAMACPLFKLKGPKMLSSDYAPAFPLKHAEKDVKLAVALGQSLGLGLPIAAKAGTAMRAAIAQGLGDYDFAAVYEAQQKIPLAAGVAPATAASNGMLPPFASADDAFESFDSTSVCYINAASRTPLPKRTLEVGLAAVRRKAETPWDIGDTEAQKDEVRALFATLLPGSSADDIAMVPSCSYAMSMAAHNFVATMRARPPSHRKVLVLHDQNPSNVMQWQQLCDDEGGVLHVIERPDDADWARAVCAALEDGSIAIAALPPCHWCDGSLVDLAPISAACRRAKCALVVDATQWLGAGPPIDVVALGIDFLACSIHKWLLGPYGGCLCYASPRFWQTAAPLEQHDRNREGAQHVECLPMGARGFPTPFMRGARRLDGGGRPSFIVLPMLLTSLKLLVHDLGVERLSAWLSTYTGEVARRAALLGFTAPAKHAPGIVGLRPGVGLPDAATIVRRLKDISPRPVLVSERFGAIRVAPHIYNTSEDLECLMRGLRVAVTGEGAPRVSRL